METEPEGVRPTRLDLSTRKHHSLVVRKIISSLTDNRQRLKSHMGDREKWLTKHRLVEEASQIIFLRSRRIVNMSSAMANNRILAQLTNRLTVKITEGLNHKREKKKDRLKFVSTTSGRGMKPDWFSKIAYLLRTLLPSSLTNSNICLQIQMSL